jgi:hypothetical protein
MDIVKLVPPRQTAFTVPKLEKPVIVVDSDDEGEKIPRLYKTAATITMTSMAQPYVIMYSNADWDLRGGLI